MDVSILHHMEVKMRTEVATPTQIVLAALSHAAGNVGTGNFNKALLHYGNSPPESVLLLQIVVKDKIVQLSPSLEKVENTIVKSIMDIANAGVNFPRPDSSAAVHESQKGVQVGKVHGNQRLQQRLASSEYIISEDEPLDSNIAEVIAKLNVLSMAERVPH